MAYACATEVSVERTLAEIKKLIVRNGATGFLQGWCDSPPEPKQGGQQQAGQQPGNGAPRQAAAKKEQPGSIAFIHFQMRGRQIKFILPLPAKEKFRWSPRGRSMRSDGDMNKAWEQGCRARWRGLLLCLKAKLESVEAGIECFDDAFMPHIVLPDGSTVGDRARPAIADAYEFKRMPPLLPVYRPQQIEQGTQAESEEIVDVIDQG